MFSRKTDIEQKINRSLNMAKLFYQNKDYNSAKNYISELLQIKPDSSEAFKLLSQINEALGENDLALKNYQKSLELKSSLADVENNFYSSPSKLILTNSNKLNSSSNNSTPVKNGPLNQNANSSPRNDEALKNIEQLIENKFADFSNLIQSFKDNLEGFKNVSNKNCQEIQLLRREISNFNVNISRIVTKQNDHEKIFFSIKKDIENNNRSLKNELMKLSNSLTEFSLETYRKFQSIFNKLETMQIKNDEDDDETHYDYDEDYDSDGQYGNTYGHYEDNKHDQEPHLMMGQGALFQQQSHHHQQQQQQQQPQLQLNDIFKLKQQDKWTCSICEVPNDQSDTKCASCEEPRYPISGQQPQQQQQSGQNTNFSFSTPQKQDSSTTATANFPFGAFKFPQFQNSHSTSPQVISTIPQTLAGSQQQQQPPPPSSSSTTFGFSFGQTLQNLSSSNNNNNSGSNSSSNFGFTNPSSSSIGQNTNAPLLKDPLPTGSGPQQQQQQQQNFMFSTSKPSLLENPPTFPNFGSLSLNTSTTTTTTTASAISTTTTVSNIFSNPKSIFSFGNSSTISNNNSNSNNVSIGGDNNTNIINNNKNVSQPIITSSSSSSSSLFTQPSFLSSSQIPFPSLTNNNNNSLFGSQQQQQQQTNPTTNNNNNNKSLFGSNLFSLPADNNNKTSSSLLFGSINKENTSNNFSGSNAGNFLFSTKKSETNFIGTNDNNKEEDEADQSNDNNSKNNQQQLNTSSSSLDGFIPKVNLPEHYDHKTGEEDEKELLNIIRAKLFILDTKDKEYKERGTGCLKILQNFQTKKLRILMRRDQTQKVCLNTPLNEEIKFENKDNRFLLFQCIDFSDNDQPIPRTCLLKLNENDRKEFLNFFENFFKSKSSTTAAASATIQQSESESKNQKQPSSKPKQQQEQKQQQQRKNDGNDEEIQLIYEKEPKPEHLPLIEKLKLPKNFFYYEEKPECKGCIGCKSDEELSWNDLTENLLKSTNEQDQQQQQNAENNDNGNVGLFSNMISNITTEKIDDISKNLNGGDGVGSSSTLETLNFVSEKSKLLPQNYQHTTGEEDEEIFYKERAKLFRFVKETNEIKERGIGEIKILKKKDKEDYRLLMRRDIVFNIICNHKIGKHILMKDRSLNTCMWATKDFSESPDGQDEILILKFKDENKKKVFTDNIQKCIENISKK